MKVDLSYVTIFVNPKFSSFLVKSTIIYKLNITMKYIIDLSNRRKAPIYSHLIYIKVTPNVRRLSLNLFRR